MRRSIPTPAAASYFWHIMDSNHMPMIAWDLGGAISYANDSFLEMLGYSREEFNNHGLFLINIHADHLPHIDEKYVQELRYKKKSNPVHRHFLKKDGSKIFVKILHAVASHTASQVFSVIQPLDKIED